MHNNSIEARTVFPQPLQQGRTEPALAAGAERVDRKGKIAKEGCGGVVKGGELAGVAGRGVSDEHPDDLRRAARGGAHGTDDVEDSHEPSGAKNSKAGGCKL